MMAHDFADFGPGHTFICDCRVPHSRLKPGTLEAWQITVEDIEAVAEEGKYPNAIEIASWIASNHKTVGCAQ